jgi:hypothetical protein
VIFEDLTMNDPLDFWMLRDTPLTDAELARLLGSRRDSQSSGAAAQGAGEGPSPSPDAHLDRWHEPVRPDEVLDALSSEGINLAEGGGVARDLENAIESAVGGWVHKH